MKTVSSKVKCIKVAALMAAMGSTAFTQSANAAAETHEINGVSVAILVEEGKISLDDPVSIR